MREWIDRVGKLIPQAIVLGRTRVYYGRPEYNRFYGYYGLAATLRDRVKMIRKNG